MSGGVVMYGGPGVPGWPTSPGTDPVSPFIPVPDQGPAESAGRILDFLRTEKKRAVVSVEKTRRGLRIKVTVDGIVVAESDGPGSTAVLTVAL